MLKRVTQFYMDGFKNLPDWARSIWFIILLKLFIMFVVFKIFFFQNKLKNDFDTDQQRADYVIEQLVK